MKSRFPDACVELCVFGCILAQTCGGSVKTSCSVLVVHAVGASWAGSLAGERHLNILCMHAWCLLTDETGSSSWRQPCTFIPEPRQGGDSAGTVASYSIALCLLENHVWQLKQILSLADAGHWVLLVSSARFGRLTAHCLASVFRREEHLT